ncbi:MAG: DUF896 domain-containing protein [Bacilli bacterium]
MDMDQLIARINVLANKKKATGLSEEETTEQQELRQLYLQNFRQGVLNQLSSIKIVDEKGKDVTPEKLQQLKNSNKPH